MTGRALIVQGDALRLPLPDASIHAVVCDPPYGLEFMGKDWDKFRPEEYKGGRWDGRGLTRKESTPGGIQATDGLPSLTYAANRKCRACGRWQRDKPHRKCICVTPDLEPRTHPYVRRSRVVTDGHAGPEQGSLL